LDKDDAGPAIFRIPASAVAEADRSVKSRAFVSTGGESIAASKDFDVHFPKVKKQ
jgi:hypothetical protein